MSIDTKHITKLWDDKWSNEILEFPLKLDRNLWVRFHSLPHSKRYPETESEYATVLYRYNQLLQDLNIGHAIFVILSEWTEESHANALTLQGQKNMPGTTYWRTIKEYASEPGVCRRLYLTRKVWQVGVLDDLLRAVANDELSGVIIAPEDFNWLFMPYDGGVDILTSSKQACSQLKAKHSDWLSSLPDGL